MKINIANLARTIITGRLEAKRLKDAKTIDKSFISVFFDMAIMNVIYGISVNQYVFNKIYELSGDEKIKRCEELCQVNKKHEEWNRKFRSNMRFLAKWTKEKYSGRTYLSFLRAKAYQKHYHLDFYPMIQYGVNIICEHGLVGKFSIGKNVLLARNVDLDYTGDLVLEDGVALSEGVKILTHNHDLYPKGSDERAPGVIPTPLVVRDHAWMGAKAMILPGVGEIGRSAIISVGAVIRNRIPPYAIVVGNPAKIVGFVYSPEEVEKYEETRYEKSQLTDIARYRKIYNKYFIERSEFIKNYLKN